MNKLLTTALLALSLTFLTASVTVVERSDRHLLLDFRLDGYMLTRQDGYIRIDAPGMQYNAQPGAPLLPYYETKIAIPPDGSISASLLSSSVRRETIELGLLPVPQVIAGPEMSQYLYVPDPELYRNAAGETVQTLDTAYFRGAGFMPLVVNPFGYDGDRTLTVTDQALIRVDILGSTSYRGSESGDELTDLLLDQVLNPDQARLWRQVQRYQVNHAEFYRADYWLRLETDRDGIYKLTPSQLSGFPIADIDPRSFRLFSNGGVLLPFAINNAGNPFVEIPIRVVGEADGSFDPGDYIVFLGTNRDGVAKNQSLQTNPTYFNPYSGNTVYWLTFGGEFDGSPLRMETLPALTDWIAETSTYTHQARLETDSQRREITGFDWYMTRLFGNSTAEYQFELELENVEPSASQFLSFQIRQEEGGNDIWHNFEVYINNVPVAADTTGSLLFKWFGNGRYTFYREVSGFTSGTNVIRLKVYRGETDNLFLNWFTLDHGRRINKADGQLSVSQLALNYGVPVRYNLSSSSSSYVYQAGEFNQAAIVPLQTNSGNSYFVASGSSLTRYFLGTDSELWTPLNISFLEPRDLTVNPPQTDNVIITADEFATQAQSLADMYWQDLGKHSLVVKQSEIFNQFNGGHPDPAALRQFLRYAFQEYPEPRLTSLTLLGLGSIDWRNFSGQAAGKNKVVVYQRGDTTAEDYFAMLTQSAFPELAVGRYPVSSVNELNNMLGNFQSYHRNPQSGWWRNSMVLLGDDLFNGSQDYYENLHTRQTQEAADGIHPSILVDKIFAWEYPYDEYQNKPAARDAMLSAINEGRLVWFYIGHGAYDNLGAEDYFNGASDMGRFRNPDKLPLFLAASCSVSHFDYWGFESLGQKTVLLNNLGAIASYSATRISNPYLNAPMMQTLMEYLANKRNPLGYSILGAKLQSSSNENDAVYVLLGDPLLKAIPPARDSLMAVQGSVNPDPEGVLHARDTAQISGSFAPSAYSGTSEIRVFNTEPEYNLDWQTHVSHRGSTLFKGSASVSGGQYDTEFIVPDDVTTGETGLIVSYLWDPVLKQDYVNYHHPLQLSDQAVMAENPDAPEIKIYLGSMDFRPGDSVGVNPTLYARISDSNGINVTGSSGHSILLILDNSLQPIPASNYFTYDLDSHTQGLLTYSFSDLAEGPHTLQVIAFDNFNQPSVATTNFLVKKSGDLAIDRFLIYPNPMQKSASFTFMLSQDADVTLDIFTVAGKKIHTIKASGRQGFNAVAWDGRDAKGDRLANNTYFVKIRAAQPGKKAEQTERLVIYN